MNATYTPGPLRAFKYADQAFRICPDVGAQLGSEIAVVYTTLADAQRFAAVPEMHAALLEFARLFGGALTRDEPINGADAVDALSRLWADYVKPALAKAAE